MQSPRPLLPFAAAVAGIAVFSAMDAVMKGAALAAGVYSAVFLRNAFGAVIMTPVWLAAGRPMSGGAALTVLHDPALAGRFCTRVIGLRDGRIVADGPPQEVLSPAFLAEVYGAAFEIAWTGGAPSIAMTGPA